MTSTATSEQSDSQLEQHFPLVVLVLTILAIVADLITEAFYYFGDLPFGLVRDALKGQELFSDAVYFSSIAFFITVLPCFIVSLFTKKNKLQNTLYIIQTIVFTLTIILFHADHEFMRYTGMHYTVADLKLYDPTQGGVVFGDILGLDARGAYSSIWILVIPILFCTISIILRKFIFKLSAIDKHRHAIFSTVFALIWIVISTEFILAFYNVSIFTYRDYCI